VYRDLRHGTVTRDNVATVPLPRTTTTTPQSGIAAARRHDPWRAMVKKLTSGLERGCRSNRYRCNGTPAQPWISLEIEVPSPSLETTTQIPVLISFVQLGLFPPRNA